MAVLKSLASARSALVGSLFVIWLAGGCGNSDSAGIMPTGAAGTNGTAGNSGGTGTAGTIGGTGTGTGNGGTVGTAGTTSVAFAKTIGVNGQDNKATLDEGWAGSFGGVFCLK